MKEDDDRHCSECKHYEICTNFYMYCKVLKRRITARKKPCKHYESFIRKQKMKMKLYLRFLKIITTLVPVS